MCSSMANTLVKVLDHHLGCLAMLHLFTAARSPYGKYKKMAMAKKEYTLTFFGQKGY